MKRDFLPLETPFRLIMKSTRNLFTVQASAAFYCDVMGLNIAVPRLLPSCAAHCAVADALWNPAWAWPG